VGTRLLRCARNDSWNWWCNLIGICSSAYGNESTRLARRDFRDAEGGGNPAGWISDELGLRDFAAQVHNSATASFNRIAIRTDEPPGAAAAGWRPPEN
jgi:hypothetical protein